MRKIAVYGTLRQGFGNYNYYLTDQHFLGEEIVNLPFKMISLGGFPGLIPSKELHDIVIEVFDVDEEAARGVDNLEGYPGWYSRKEIKTSHGDAWIYFFGERHQYDSRDAVPNGDWKEFKNQPRTYINEIFS